MGKQNLLIAEKMYRGEAFEDPFHRAPLYPFIITLAQRVNVFGFETPTIARILNGIALLVTTWFSAHLAWLIWKQRYAIWIGGLAVGLNPVLVFFCWRSS